MDAGQNGGTGVVGGQERDAGDGQTRELRHPGAAVRTMREDPTWGGARHGHEQQTHLCSPYVSA